MDIEMFNIEIVVLCTKITSSFFPWTASSSLTC